ncbi:MAG: YggT family protein [Dehalococcoidia bacterium]|nr:hypothetical protein [Chloroflexota bacterium]MCH2525833.1 YggT family protein [Dehalococcoidia bacterium]MQF99944.1 YggT family protein [SAR202 cluster bacterium]
MIYLVQFLHSIITVIILSIFGRVIMDWLVVGRIINHDNRLRFALMQITEPILGPVRRFATIGVIDLSPIVVMILLSSIQQILASSL